jgi:hypothetical protein
VLTLTLSLVTALSLARDDLPDLIRGIRPAGVAAGGLFSLTRINFGVASTPARHAVCTGAPDDGADVEKESISSWSLKQPSPVKARTVNAKSSLKNEDVGPFGPNFQKSHVEGIAHSASVSEQGASDGGK